jgi:5-hydroxyisourate hydrolase
MGKLSTHVLDTMHGRPAQGVRIDLYDAGQAHKLIKTTTTNADGRCDEPLLSAEDIKAGTYELVIGTRAPFPR